VYNLPPGVTLEMIDDSHPDEPEEDLGCPECGSMWGFDPSCTPCQGAKKEFIRRKRAEKARQRSKENVEDVPF
jgi:hypothetical protein